VRVAQVFGYEYQPWCTGDRSAIARRSLRHTGDRFGDRFTIVVAHRRSLGDRSGAPTIAWRSLYDRSGTPAIALRSLGDRSGAGLTAYPSASRLGLWGGRHPTRIEVQQVEGWILGRLDNGQRPSGEARISPSHPPRDSRTDIADRDESLAPRLPELTAEALVWGMARDQLAALRQ
jgi:hypothetical protein